MKRSVSLFYLLHALAIAAAFIFSNAAQANDADKILAVQQAMIQQLQADLEVTRDALAQLKGELAAVKAAQGSTAGDLGNLKNTVTSQGKTLTSHGKSIKSHGKSIASHGKTIKSTTKTANSVNSRLGNFKCSGSKCSLPNGSIHITYKRKGKPYSIYLPEGWTNRPSVCRDGTGCSALGSPP